MLHTFWQVLPFALGGAINPVGILIIFFILGGSKPIKRCWLFLAGSALFLVFFTAIAYLWLPVVIARPHEPTAISAIVDLALGLILISLAIFKPKKKSGHNNWHNDSGAFWYGFLFMIFDLSSLVFYISAVKATIGAKLSIAFSMTILSLVIIIIMSSMLLPVLMVTIMPDRSAGALNWLKRILNDYGRLIGQVVILLIAIYLIFKGLITLW